MQIIRNLSKYALVGALVLVFSHIAHAQQAVPVPTKTPVPSDTDVVKISTNLIQIDVTVTDKKGKVVTDLRPDEIEIRENGEKVNITNFSFISNARTITEKPNPVDKTVNNAIPVPPPVLRPEQIRRTIALVVDDLSLSFESAASTRQALKKFVDEQMQEGDLVAIVRTGAGIGALQQFTSDKRLLYAAIEKVKWNPLGAATIGAFAPIEPTPLELQKQMGDSTVSDEDLADEQNRINSFNDFRGSVFATGTLGALRYIVTGMSELPGRKSVILFSDGWRMFERDEHGFTEGGGVLDFLTQLVDQANRSSVVFYTIDARGLVYTGYTAADQITDSSPQAMSAALSSRSDELFETQAGLSFLAEETGGIAIKNNNDLSGGVRRVLDDQSYYLIGYEPDSDTFDPSKRKFNKLEVRVSRPGLSVRYRSGFFNHADKPTNNIPTTAATPAAQLENALVSPFAISGLNLRLNALFGSDPKDGAFVRSLLHIDTNDLKFTDEKDGTKKAVFDVLAMSFGDNGNPVDQIRKTYTLTLRPERLNKLIESGIVYHFTFPVKKPGAYQYRVAIRDVQGGKVGSASQFIEVPDLKKNRLTASSIVLENYTADEWRRAMDPKSGRIPTNPMADTALRRVKVGSVVRYGFEIYNAKLNASKQPGVQTKIRVFRDGKLILDGQQIPLDMRDQTDMLHLKAGGAIALSDKMTPGDYILQVVVTDPLAKLKQQIATQFVQFEVVE